MSGIALRHYTVLADDTLQDIAQAQLGDATRWTEIASLNHLRAPYVSQVLTDHLGPVYTAPPLQAYLPAGATQIVNNVGAATPFAAGNVLAFVSTTDQGDPDIDALLITGTQPGTQPGTITITFQRLVSYHSLTGRMQVDVAGTRRAHAAGSRILVYLAPALLQTAVAWPGDVLALPAAGTSAGEIAAGAADSQLITALGVDLALDTSGHLRRGDDGDLGRVAGIADMQQAANQRVATARGEQVGHINYGNQAVDYLGTTQGAATRELMRGLTAECLLGDPRIRTVPSVRAHEVGDATYVDADIGVAPNDQIITITGIDVTRLLGGST